ncbi:hypothetical protein MTP99_012185 [Tenebrio molitor]|jgi:hypothetical protein|uniref:RING-type domain-containing protein n=1 Tax=Tenebrio molitor TaxID=7067 RepID=A0A8J6H8W1_TENMO|nr:hypothetical protein GEV33_012806 [Tenebrio molitor]KAJ3631028.1 hypothetical protein MTP99_012185 [Tenebrio molitor]CAH1370625.1 unnamed protein product [Tenebrio molitor]
MDLSVLKGPAEVLASRVKAFKNCLELATECLTNKDYVNAEMIYGGLLADLHKNCVVEVLNLNDLELFSLHSCFAYSSIGSDFKSEQALVILNSIHKPIKLPLVPYLKAFVHISNDRISFAHDELQSCQTLLNDGYNFKPNSILNEDIVPEINDEFLKLKLNGLKFACELLKAKEDNEDLKKCFKENWLKIGKLCETDFAKLTKKNKPEEEPKETVEKKSKKSGQKETGAIKKTDKQTQKIKMETVAIQATPRGINVAVQTMEKDVSQQLLNAVLDIKNKVNNLQNKRDNEVKQLQRKNNELNDKLIARDNKRQDKSAEFEFLRDQYLSLEKKYEQSQKQVDLLQKLLMEQFQQKYQMQKNIYQLFEEKCDYKIEYLTDIHRYLNVTDKPSPDECKQEVFLWRNTLGKVGGAKKNFETYYRSIDDLIIAKKYSSIKTSDWPGIPHIPNDVQDVIYRNFKSIIQQSKSFYSVSYPYFDSSMFGNFSNCKENFHNPNYFVSSYNTYNEDGRITGSPPSNSKSNPATPISNGGRKQPPGNKKYTVAPPSTEVTNVYQTEQDLLKFLQSNFEDVGEIELLEAIYQVRDMSEGGTLIGIPKTYLVNEIKKILKKNKSGKMGWNNVSQVKWHNDHTESKCCICFEEYDASTVQSLPCQHEFHKKCITNWLKRQSACPVCRVHTVIDDEFPPLKPQLTSN